MAIQSSINSALTATAYAHKKTLSKGQKKRRDTFSTKKGKTASDSAKRNTEAKREQFKVVASRKKLIKAKRRN